MTSKTARVRTHGYAKQLYSYSKQTRPYLPLRYKHARVATALLLGFDTFDGQLACRGRQDRRVRDTCRRITEWTPEQLVDDRAPLFHVRYQTLAKSLEVLLAHQRQHLGSRAVGDVVSGRSC